MATTVTIQADLGRTTISRHLYGHFSEHLGRCIYGGWWVGEDSPIPNTRGLRNDLVDALKAIGIPNLRWPGGCFADEYHWRNGIGPRSQRPTMINTHWGGVVENNHFGTHEFLDLCGLLGCEPYICGNVGSGTVREMSEWVEYLNFDGVSPMADLRRANGRDEPWGVTYWGVGNENWGCGGNMRAEYYADVYRRYACYCRNYGDSKLFRIAGGPNSGDYHWTEVLMREAGRFMDGLSLHHYTAPGDSWQDKGSATEFGERAWFRCMKGAWHTDELVTRHSAIMDRHDPGRRVALVVDEWGTWYNVEPGTNPGFLYQQNTLRDALVAAISLNVFNHHAGRVRMANIAQTVNVLQAMCLTEGDQLVRTPTWHVFEMYRPHHDATLLPCTVSETPYSLDGEPLQAISASASVAAEGPVTVTLANADHARSHEVVLKLRGASPATAIGRLLSDPALNAHNTFEAPDRLSPKQLAGLAVNDGTLRLNLPAASVAAVTLT